MDSVSLLKKKKGYGWAFVFLFFGIYAVGKAGEHTGYTGSEAIYLVGLNAVLVFAMIYCAVMWFKVRAKIKANKTEHKEP